MSVIERNPELHSKTGKTIVEQYGWKIVDQPGSFQMIDKRRLIVDERYQRKITSKDRVFDIARHWSWFALGALSVVPHGDKFSVIDGQHRHMAAMSRADISLLPCLVFLVDSVASEAAAFLRLNANRKPITQAEKFTASVTADDPTASTINAVLGLYGYHISKNTNELHGVRCIGRMQKICKDSPDAFENVFTLCARIANGKGIHESLLAGLHYIYQKTNGEVCNPMFASRLQKLGSEVLVAAADRMATALNAQSPKNWAMGIRDVHNRGLRKNFIQIGDEQ